MFSLSLDGEGLPCGVEDFTPQGRGEGAMASLLPPLLHPLPPGEGRNSESISFSLNRPWDGAKLPQSIQVGLIDAFMLDQYLKNLTHARLWFDQVL